MKRSASITIPESVKVLEDFAFYNCTGLEEINLPKNLTSIGSYALNNCSKLISEIVIPNGVTAINDGTFYGCAYFEHSMIAERVIHKDEPTLEEEGWVKMYKSQLFPFDAPDYYLSQPRWNHNRHNYLTKAQIDVLLEKGYKIRPWDTRDWDGEMPV